MRLKTYITEKKFVKSVDSNGKKPMVGYWYDDGKGNFIMIDRTKSKKYKTYNKDFRYSEIPTDAEEITSWKLTNKFFDVKGKEVKVNQKLPNDYVITKIEKSKASLEKGDMKFTPQSPRSFLSLVYGREFNKLIK